jgi:hypothetical protein
MSMDASDKVPPALRGWSKTAKVFAVLAIILAMAVTSVLLLYMDDMCKLRGHRWSWLYTLMVIAAAGPIIILFAQKMLLPFTSLSQEAIRSIGLLGLLICVPFWAFTIFATNQIDTWPGYREEPQGPAFCRLLRR